MNKYALIGTLIWILVGLIEWLRLVIPKENRKEIRDKLPEKTNEKLFEEGVPDLKLKYPIAITLPIMLVFGVPLSLIQLFKKK